MTQELIYDIYVSILLLSFICYQSKNNQNLMLSNIYNKTIFIYKFYQELFPTNMLEFWFPILCSCTMVYLEVKAYIKC